MQWVHSQGERARRLVIKSTPWRKPPPDNAEKAPSTHGICLCVYVLLMFAYIVFAITQWSTAPEVVTYSSEEAKDFGTVELTVEIACTGCTMHAMKSKLWTLSYKYDAAQFPHCGGVEDAMNDVESATAILCRSTDDMSDNSGIRVWIGNISKEVTSTARIVVSGPGSLSAVVPLQHWHEKSLLLGLVVHRDDEDCTSASECDLSKEIYMANQQYDGHVTWGGEDWGGGQLNIKLLRFAQVYTTHSRRTIFDVLSDIGGASSILLFALGIMVAGLEFLESRKRLNRQVTEVKLFAAEGTTASPEEGEGGADLRGAGRAEDGP